MSEWLRRQIQDLLRKLMGSNPIPRKEFLCSLKTGWWQVRIFRTSAPALLRRVVGGGAAVPQFQKPV